MGKGARKVDVPFQLRNKNEEKTNIHRRGKSTYVQVLRDGIILNFVHVISSNKDVLESPFK